MEADIIDSPFNEPAATSRRKNGLKNQYDGMTSAEIVDHAAEQFARLFLDQYLYNKRMQAKGISDVDYD